MFFGILLSVLSFFGRFQFKFDLHDALSENNTSFHFYLKGILLQS